MPRLTTLVSLFIAAILCGSLFAADTQPTIQSINRMPLAFTKNMGQWDDRVLFRANSGGATMWFTKDGITYQFTRRIANPVGAALAAARDTGVTAGDREGRPYNPGDRFSDDRDSIEQLVLTAKFVGANPNPEIIAEGQMEYKCNYFLGNDPTKWHTDVPNYEAITLKDIYPGIDLKYSGDGNGQAAYEFIAAPGADIAQIKVAYEGAEETSLAADGRMILKTNWGDMIAAIKSGVLSGSTTCAWWTSSSTTSRPDLAHGDVRQALAEKSGTLTLSYSTYLGGAGDDYGIGIAVDDSGNAYVTGSTGSSDFPTLNPYQTYGGNEDVFVTKLTGSGNIPIYRTYIGGENYDGGYGVAVDVSGNAFVTGLTASSNFPTQNEYQTYQGGSDVFIFKLSSSGNNLTYSTFLGGTNQDVAYDIAIGDSGNAYVTGWTNSLDFPTLNPCQTRQGGGDAFVTELSSSGSSLIYSTYLGGGSQDVGWGIAVDGSGNAYVTGWTGSPDFPTLNPFQSTLNGGGDAFVTKLSSTGSGLIYSTYLGGANGEGGNSVTVDRSGNAYVTGTTSSSDFPAKSPFQSTLQGLQNAFVTKLASLGNCLIYSTYLGGGDYDEGYGIAVDGSGNAYVTGYSSSFNFPTLNPYQTDQGGYDAFVTKLPSSGDSLIYCTYLGGADWDVGAALAVDNSGNAYLTGNTLSYDYPTRNPYLAYQGGFDAFVTKLSWTPNYSCGDVNTDERIDLLDVVFLINYIFVGGPAPHLLSLADVNCSGSINIADVVLMINYIFRAGPAPCTECE